MAEAQRSCETKKQLYFSYCHRDNQIVHRVALELSKVNYKIWIDTKDLIQGQDLYKNIQNGIELSHVVICFMSKSYFESKTCMNEITFAFNLKKTILPIMLDTYFKVENQGIKFMISRLIRFDAFKPPNTFCPWSNDIFEKLKETIFQLLSEICLICSNKIKNKKQGMFSIESIDNVEKTPTSENPANAKSQRIFAGIFNFRFDKA
jgi:hypothetical protein